MKKHNFLDTLNAYNVQLDGFAFDSGVIYGQGVHLLTYQDAHGLAYQTPF